MYSKTLAAALVFITISCKNANSPIRDHNSMIGNVSRTDNVDTADNVNPYKEIADIPVPNGYKRNNNDENSFSHWLGKIHLKKSKTVHLYDGSKKNNQSAQFAVLDIPVGSKDLQQCADAVMRLRASYLYDMQKFDSIVFYDYEGKSYRFSYPYNQDHFNNFLQTVFSMCGTASLSKQLKKTDYSQIEPGDVLIRGGFPGHAVIVTDVVVNKDGLKKYMLAQSYMPAQEIHILINPATGDSPWYDVNDDEMIETPEYLFYSFELKRW